MRSPYRNRTSRIPGEPGPTVERRADLTPVASDHLGGLEGRELLPRRVEQPDVRLPGERRSEIDVARAHRDELRERVPVVLLDRGHPARVQHREGVDEPCGLRATREREAGVGEATVVRLERRAEHRAGAEPRPRPADRDRPRHPDRAELLRVALVPAPREREVFVDPDVDAPRVRLPLVSAADDHEAFLVLRAHGVEQFLAGVAARLPVGPDDRDGAGVLLREVDTVRKERRDASGIRAVLDRHHVAGVVPRWCRNERRPALGRPRREEPLQLGHGCGVYVPRPSEAATPRHVTRAFPPRVSRQDPPLSPETNTLPSSVPNAIVPPPAARQ